MSLFVIHDQTRASLEWREYICREEKSVWCHGLHQVFNFPVLEPPEAGVPFFFFPPFPKSEPGALFLFDIVHKPVSDIVHVAKLMLDSNPPPHLFPDVQGTRDRTIKEGEMG